MATTLRRRKLAIPPPSSDARAFVVLEGTSALLMSKWTPEEAADPSVMKRSRSKTFPAPAKEAEAGAYRLANHQLYLPSAAIRASVVTAGKFFQNPQYKKGTMMDPLASALAPVATEGSVLYRNKKPLTTYEVDSRRCVIPSTKGSITRHRARIDAPWTTTVELAFEIMTINEEMLLQVIATAGAKVGVLAYRPEKRGPFGRFTVKSFEVQV